jgi:hypothetical protein
VGAALEEPTLGDAPVEGVHDAPGGAGALWVAALAKPAIPASPPVGATSTLRATRLSVHSLPAE